jgi:hypothetical protein
VTRFLVMAVVGGLLSLSISVALIALVFAVIVAVLPALAWRSLPALSGALVGWGGTWVALGGRTYSHCVSMGPNCGGSEGILAFVLIGAVVLFAGLVVGWLALRRSREPEAARHS